MNFKTPFKVLTTAALIGTLSLSAVAPGVASAATKTTSVVKAKETANLNIASVVLAKKADLSDKVLISYQLAGELLGNNSAMNGYEIVAIITEDGTVFDYQLFGEYAGNGTPVETLKQMADAGATTSISGDVKVGELADGKLATTDTPAELPGEEATFEVTEIAAITENGVTVNFPKLTADKEGVTVEVKDSKGNVVAVEPLDLSAGEETAEFAFKTPVKSEDLTGTWTVDGKQIDLSLVKNLAAFEDATAQTAVYKALQDLGIENLTSDNAASYASKKADFLDDLAKEDKELTKEAIQAFVDKVNADSLTGEEEAKIIKALVAAKGNNVKIAEVLSNPVFKQVNSSWVEVATDGYAAKFDLGTNIDEDSTIAEVQAEIDEANEAQINKEITATFPSESVDKEKLAELQTLIDTYAPVDEDGKLVDTITTIKPAVAAIKKQSAVADVLAATTASKLKTAVAALATIVDDKAVLDASKYVDANGKAYIDTIKDLNSSTPKLTAADYGVTDKINTAAELGTLITKVNTLATDAAATKLVDAIKTAATNYITTKNTTNQGKLVAALQAAGLKEVSTDKANKDAYSETDGSTKTLDLILAATTPNTTADEAKTALATIQAKIDAANIAVVDAADKDGIVAALAVIGTKNVVSANAQAYVTAVEDLDSKDDIQDAVDVANTAANVTAGLKALNEAKDATEAKAALATLANNGVATEYAKVVDTDKEFIAEKVLEARDEQTDKKFAAKEDVTTAVQNATTARINAITTINALPEELDAGETSVTKTYKSSNIAVASKEVNSGKINQVTVKYASNTSVATELPVTISGKDADGNVVTVQGTTTVLDNGTDLVVTVDTAVGTINNITTDLVVSVNDTSVTDLLASSNKLTEGTETKVNVVDKFTITLSEADVTEITSPEASNQTVKVTYNGTAYTVPYTSATGTTVIATPTAEIAFDGAIAAASTITTKYTEAGSGDETIEDVLAALEAVGHESLTGNLVNDLAVAQKFHDEFAKKYVDGTLTNKFKSIKEIQDFITEANK